MNTFLLELYVCTGHVLHCFVEVGRNCFRIFCVQSGVRVVLKWLLSETGKVVNRSGGKEDCMPCMPVLQSVEPVCFRAGSGCMLNITGRNLLQKNTK